MTDDERLEAYVDGELRGPELAAFEAAMAADPHLAREVARRRAVSARISAAYRPVIDEPVPAHLIALASAANDPGRSRPGVRHWAAMAACLVLGVTIGRTIWPESGALAARDGVLVARGGLENALTTQLASDHSAARQLVKVGVSFRTAEGAYCRTFQSPRDRLAGLACHENGRWVAHTITALASAPAPAYRMAASDTPPEVLAAVDALIAGPALDAAGERAARDRGWRP